MSVATTLLAESSPTWLQPVQYNLDGFRRFSGELDKCLGLLEQANATRHRAPVCRPGSIETMAKCDADPKGQSQLPSA